MCSQPDTWKPTSCETIKLFISDGTSVCMQAAKLKKNV